MTRAVVTPAAASGVAGEARSALPASARVPARRRRRPLERRAGRDQQPRDADVVGSGMLRVARGLRPPTPAASPRTSRRARSTSAPYFEQHPHRVHVAAHRGAVERRDVVLVSRLRIEAARQHRLEDRRVAALGRTVEHEVVLGSELGSAGPDARRASRRPPARSARAHAATKRSSGDSSSTAPCASSHAAISALPYSSASVCGVRAVGAAARDIRAVLDEPLDHRHVPATGRDVQRRLAGLAPREIRRPRRDRAASTGLPDCRPTASCRRAAARRRGCRSRSGRSGAAIRARRDCRRRRQCAPSRRRSGSRPPRAAPPRAADARRTQTDAHSAVRGSSGCQFQWYSAFGFAPSAQQTPGDGDESLQAGRIALVHRRVADVEQRLPVLRPAWPLCELGMVSEPLLDGCGVAEDERRLQRGRCDPRMQREQSLPRGRSRRRWRSG